MSFAYSPGFLRAEGSESSLHSALKYRLFFFGVTASSRRKSNLGYLALEFDMYSICNSLCEINMKGSHVKMTLIL